MSLDWVASESPPTAVQKGGVDEAVALCLFSLGFWPFSQVLEGLSRDPPPSFRPGVASPLSEVGESSRLVCPSKSNGRN